MLLLISKTLLPATEQHLQTKQNEVNTEPTFAQQADKAIDLWKAKQGTIAGRQAFENVKQTLTDMTVGEGICNYCEANEATDIEHIYPKSIFPQFAFVWDNYLLACGKCNTHEKSNDFSVFNPTGSKTALDVKPPKGQYIASPTIDALFINPRKENPMIFMRLDFATGEFVAIANDTTSRNYQRAQHTIELLGLNRRIALKDARKKAEIFYMGQLAIYQKLKNATNHQELEKSITGNFPEVNHQTPFLQEQQRLMDCTIRAIKKHKQPTVWEELKRQRENYPKTKALFEALPEALQW